MGRLSLPSPQPMHLPLTDRGPRAPERGARRSPVQTVLRSPARRRGWAEGPAFRTPRVRARRQSSLAFFKRREGRALLAERRPERASASGPVGGE